MNSLFKCTKFALAALILCVVVDASAESTRMAITPNQINQLKMLRLVHPKFHPVARLRRSGDLGEKQCENHDLEMLLTIMQRICLLCHEIKSHYKPNTRVECSRDCFQNSTFHACMRIFSGVTRTGRVEPTAPVPLYTEEAQTLDAFQESNEEMERPMNE